MNSNLDNLYIRRPATNYNYKPISRPGGDPNYPNRTNRRTHADRLEEQLNKAWELAEQKQLEMEAVSVPSRQGIYLEIKGQAGYDLISESLEYTGQGQSVRICNTKTEGKDDKKKVISSTVFVPNNKRGFFLKKLNKYKETEGKGKVIGTIESINLAVVDALWTSKKTEIQEKIPKWCEVWLMYVPKEKEKTDEIISEFYNICLSREIQYKEQKILFPERIILSV